MIEIVAMARDCKTVYSHPLCNSNSVWKIELDLNPNLDLLIEVGI